MARSTQPGDQVYVSFDGTPLEAERLNPIGNGHGQFMFKPTGGLWTSSHLGAGESAFTDFVRADPNTSTEHWLGAESRRYLLRPAADVNLLVLDRRRDLDGFGFGAMLHRTLARYRRNQTRSRVVAELLAAQPSWVDWTPLADRFDGIWARGWLPPHWDCECIVWFRWCFDEVGLLEPLG